MGGLVGGLGKPSDFFKQNVRSNMELYNPIGIFILIALVGFGLIKFVMGLLFPDDCDKEQEYNGVDLSKYKKEFEV